MYSRWGSTGGLRATAAAFLVLLPLNGAMPAVKSEADLPPRPTEGQAAMATIPQVPLLSGASTIPCQTRAQIGQYREYAEWAAQAADALRAPAPKEQRPVLGGSPGPGWPEHREGDPRAGAPLRMVAQDFTENLLKNMWASMKAALLASEIERALEFFTPSQRPRYRGLFAALRDHLPQVAGDLGDIQLVYIQEHRAKFRMRRGEFYGGQQTTFTYYVYFVQDAAGRWYIEEF